MYQILEWVSALGITVIAVFVFIISGMVLTGAIIAAALLWLVACAIVHLSSLFSRPKGGENERGGEE